MDFVNYFRSSFNLSLNKEEGFNEVNKNISFNESLLFYGLLSFLTVLIVKFVENWVVKSSTKSVLELVLVETFIFLFFALMCFVLFYTIVYYMFKFFKVKSNFKDVLKFGIWISAIPLIVEFLFSLIGNIIYLGTPFSTIVWNIFDIVIFGVYGVVLLSLFVWMFFINVKVFENLYHLDKSKIVLSLCSPFIVLVLFLGLISLISFLIKILILN